MYSIVLYDTGQYFQVEKEGIVSVFPENTNNKDYQAYLEWLLLGNEPLIIDNTTSAMDLLRNKRNILLDNSDWTQTLDSPVDKTVWAVYRQALRDLPENTVDPKNPVWPMPPNEM